MAESSKSSTSYIAEIDGRDRLEAIPNGNGFSLHVVGCSKLLQLLSQLKQTHGADIKNWTLPEGSSHEILLVRELILKVRGEWQYPYNHAELCHCRTIATHLVDQAILSGAHTPEVVSRRTSASTACGTCRPNVQNIIDYRLQKNQKDQKKSA
jgi:bacterioferritin-associated ferredoxin